jgi:hypothetical protein
MKMSEVKTHCNPGSNWGACEAQRWNTTVEVIEEEWAAAQAWIKTQGELRPLEKRWREYLHYHQALRARGLKRAAYCESCGSQYDG